MRLQTRLTLAICSGLALAAAACFGASQWFTSDLIDKTMERRVDAQAKEISSRIAEQSNRALALARFVAAMPAVTKAFAAQDRAALQALVGPTFATIKEDGVEQFQFHLPPAISFLRVHSPAKFGDDLASFRQTVVETNRDRKPIRGLESGVAGIGIRGVTPVFEKGQHVGSVEFGLAFGQAFAADVTQRTGARIAIFLDDGKGGMTRHATTFPEDFAFKAEDLKAAHDGAARNANVTIEDKPFTWALTPLADYSGMPIGVLAVALDYSDLNATRMQGMMVFGTLSALMLALGAMLAWWLQRDIGRPLKTMTERMTQLAEGRLAVEIPSGGGIDEVRAMAGAVQVFKDAAIEKTRLEAQTQEQRRQAEEERAAREAAKAMAAREQQDAMIALASGLARLSEGDLTSRLIETFAEDYEKLRQDFNAAVSQLQDTMSVVSRSTHGINSGSDEISQAADDLSRRTEQQAASLEETAAALDEITTTVRKTAESALHARSVVQATKEDADHSSGVVRDAVTAMGEIEKSSGQISSIIGVIDEIAFQTNLLALNAGVEAARAGEAGRGFAVVATEVRALAQRSAGAAKEIKALIHASTSQIGTGVKLVDEVGTALSRIAAQVGEINQIVADIAGSAQEQATGLQQVNIAVNQMDQVTQQNAAMVEESTAASHSLAQEATQLSQLIGRFRVEEQAKDRNRAARAA